VVIAQEDRASVRVIHGVSDAGPIDLYIDGAIAVVGATFPSVTDPLAVSGGEHRIVVTPSGAGIEAALVDSTLEIEEGTTDEIAVVGSVAGLSAVLFEVDRSPLAEDQTRIRIVNASPDAGPIAPTLAAGDPAFPSVDFLLATEYVEVPAGVYPLDLALTNGGVDPLAVADLGLEAGTVTDIYVVGQVADGTLQPLVVGARARQGAPEGQDGTGSANQERDANDDQDQGQDQDEPQDQADSPALAVATEPQPSAIRAGTCAALGDEVAAISEVAAATGAEVGVQDGAPVANGFATVPVAFDAIVAADHAIVVGGTEQVACGEVAGRLTDDGSLVVPLLAGNGDARGVAVLFPNVLDPTTTDVSVFFVPGSASDAQQEAVDVAAEPPVAEAGEEPAVTVAVEAVGTPAPDPAGSPGAAVEQAGA
jgi:hypothetical protein